MKQAEHKTTCTGARLAAWCGAAVLLLVLLVFAAMSIVGSYSTCAVEIGFSEDNDEHVAFLSDSPLGNLLVLAAVVGIAGWVLSKNQQREVSPSTLRLCTLGMLLLVTILGIYWVISAHAVPYADSDFILQAARRLASGDASVLATEDYFRIFPFQLGFTAYAELFYRVFGTQAPAAMGICNVLFVDAAYLGVLDITKRLFPDGKTRLLTVFLLALCWQPVFLSTFLYGFLPSCALSIWAVSFVVRFFQSGKFVHLLPGAVLSALAVVLKKNAFLVVIACGILLLLSVLKTRGCQQKIKALLGILLLSSLSLLLPFLVQTGYETRADVSLGSGTPQGAWLVTGFSESSFCSGWYGSYTTTVLRDCGFDTEAAKAKISEDLSAEFGKFSGRPRYLAAFFYHKLVSQWNEPAFQSIWSSAAGEHSAPLSPVAESISYGRLGEGLRNFFNYYVEVIYVGFALCMFFLFRGFCRAGSSSAPCRKPLRFSLPPSENAVGEAVLILPLIILGAFLYHGLFEAKSQYAILYLPMMLPYAARALTVLWERTPSVLTPDQASSRASEKTPG